MKTVILAGGFGTRFSEETFIRPKPLIEIDGKPILCHLMDIYSSQGYNDFVLCLGYKSIDIKKWFLDQLETQNDFILDFVDGSKKVISEKSNKWKISFIDTGDATNTAGRVRRISHLISDERFFLTYADGLGNVDLESLLNEHISGEEKLVTLTATPGRSRFGEITISGDMVEVFQEKPTEIRGMVNSGFFVVEKKIFDYFDLSDEDSWEKGVLEPLSKEGKLGAYKHNGFWQPMDTLRDKRELETQASHGQLPWLNFQ